MQAQKLSQADEDKEFQFKVPQQISMAGKIIGAVYVEFGQTQCIALYNNKQIYFLQIIEGAVMKYSSYNLTGIVNLVSIIKGYLVITTKQQKLWLFQLKKIDKKVQGESAANTQNKVQKILTVESYLKEIAYASFSLRQVTPNMVQLFITSSNQEKAQKVIYIYQFTVNQKVGGMGFTVDKNFKIISHSRKHMYASKNFYDPSINSLIKFKNFSDMNFLVKKLPQQLIIIPIGKTQQYTGLTKNFQLINPQNTQLRKKIQQQLKGCNLQTSQFYLNYMLIQDNQDMIALFVVEDPLKIRILTHQSKQYKWQICFNGKLVGVKNDNTFIRVTKQLNKKTNSFINEKVQKVDSLGLNNTKVNQESKEIKNNLNISDQKIQINQKVEKKQQQIQLSKDKSNFKPMKILSRKDIKKQTGMPPNESTQKSEKINSEIKAKKQTCLPKADNKQQKPQKTVQNTKQQEQTQRLTKDQSQAIKTQKSENTPEKEQVQSINIKENYKQKVDNKGIQKSPFSKNKTPQISSEQKKAFNLSITYQEVFGKNRINTQKNKSVFLNKQKGVEEQNAKNQIQSLLKNQKNKSIEIAYLKGEAQISKLNDQAYKLDTLQVKKQPQQQKRLQQKQKQHVQDQKIEKKAQEIVAQETKKQQQYEQSSQVKLSQENSNIAQQKKREEECCINLYQSKKSYQNFIEAIKNLQSKSTNLVSQFQTVSKQLLKQTQTHLNLTQQKIISSNLEKFNNQIKETTQSSFNQYFGKKLTTKVNDYFKLILPETKKVFESSLKFYSEKKKQSIISLQNHFQQQQHLVNQIRVVSTDMVACVDSTVYQGEQNLAYLMKQWEKISMNLCMKLEANLQTIQNYSSKKTVSQKQKIIDTLEELKISIENEQNKSKKQRQNKTKKVKIEKKKQKQDKNQNKKQGKSHKSSKQKGIKLATHENIMVGTRQRFNYSRYPSYPYYYSVSPY